MKECLWKRFAKSQVPNFLWYLYCQTLQLQSPLLLLGEVEQLLHFNICLVSIVTFEVLGMNTMPHFGQILAVTFLPILTTSKEASGLLCDIGHFKTLLGFRLRREYFVAVTCQHACLALENFDSSLVINR